MDSTAGLLDGGAGCAFLAGFELDVDATRLRGASGRREDRHDYRDQKGRTDKHFHGGLYPCYHHGLHISMRDLDDLLPGITVMFFDKY